MWTCGGGRQAAFLVPWQGRRLKDIFLADERDVRASLGLESSNYSLPVS